jgi:hypothetical protein
MYRLKELLTAIPRVGDEDYTLFRLIIDRLESNPGEAGGGFNFKLMERQGAIVDALEDKEGQEGAEVVLEDAQFTMVKKVMLEDPWARMSKDLRAVLRIIHGAKQENVQDVIAGGKELPK